MSKKKEVVEEVVEKATLANDKHLAPLFAAVEAIPPYHISKLTNLRHILSTVRNFERRLKEEIEIKADSGSYDPNGHEVAIEAQKEVVKQQKANLAKREGTE